MMETWEWTQLVNPNPINENPASIRLSRVRRGGSWLNEMRVSEQIRSRPCFRVENK